MKKIELKKHNENVVKEIKSALRTGNKACSVRATGTGKSYIIAKIAEDYSNVLICAPNSFIINQQRNLIGPDKKIKYATYSSLIQKTVKSQLI